MRIDRGTEDIGCIGGDAAAVPYVEAPSLVPTAQAALLKELAVRLTHPTIVVFDSGLGGLTVYREIVAARPDARIVYVADDAAFPYGAFDEGSLVTRVLTVMEKLVERIEPDLVVIACNTASTLCLPALRARFDMPFVGTVPAVKPACAASVTRRVSVLGTRGTVSREYTRDLVRKFAGDCKVTLVGAPRLAGYAEAEMRGEPASDDAIRAEILPCFVEDEDGRTDTLVLACTHYPLLASRIEALAPWPVRLVDPAPAIARRVVSLIGTAVGDTGERTTLFTSGKAADDATRATLAGFGLKAA